MDGIHNSLFHWLSLCRNYHAILKGLHENKCTRLASPKALLSNGTLHYTIAIKPHLCEAFTVYNISTMSFQ